MLKKTIFPLKKQSIGLLLIILSIIISLLYNFNGHFWDERKNIYYHLLYLVITCFILNLFKNKKIILNKLDIIVVLILLCTFLTRFLRLKSLNDIHLITTLVLTFYYLLIVNFNIKKVAIETYYLALTTISFLLCIFCCLEYFYFIEPISYNWRITGNFSNPALIGGFISSLMPFSIFYFFLSKRNNYKIFIGIVVIFIQLFIIYVSNSRTAIICCLFTFLILIAFKINKKKIIFLAPVFIVAVFFTLSIKSSDSLLGRVLIWKISLLNFFKNPITGIGYNFFSVDYINFQADYFKENYIEKEILLAGATRYAFNEPLKFIIENGALGLIIVLYGLHMLCKNNIRSSSNIVFTQISFFTSFFVFASFSYPLHFLPFKLILLHQLAFVKLNNQIILNLKRYSYTLNSIFITLFLISIYKVRAVHLWKTGYYLNNKYSSIKMYKQVYNMIPNNGKFLFDYAKLEKNINNLKAIRIYNKALKTYNNPYIYNTLAILYAKEKRTKKTEALLQKAHFSKPSLFEPLEKLLDFYTLHNNNTQKELIIEKIIKTPVKIKNKKVKKIRKKAFLLKKNNTFRK